MFSSSFSRAFCAGLEYIGPTMAQAALVAGAAIERRGAALLIGGRWLIGPAGKVYQFASAESCAVWVDNAIGAAQREAEIIAALDADRRAAWIEKKRKKLETVASRVVNSAAKINDAAKRAALLDESNYCLSKWA